VPLWQSNPDSCCAKSKVGQLDWALTGKLAWMSGIRRAESPTRRAVPIVARHKRGLVKVNPLANWDDHDVEIYVADHEVPVNPLIKRGYPSIGCWPCTRPVAPGEEEDNRSG
jgi:phosphoadenosine phosphosulfate reductase